MRRVILLLSAAVLLVSACGGGTGKNRSSGSTTPSATASATTATEPPTPEDSPTVPGSRAITLLSGRGPLPTYTIENGRFAGETGQVPGTFYCGGYHLTEGTDWVGLQSECGEFSHASAGLMWSRAVYTHYDVTFRLPRGFTSPSISVLVLVDDTAEVFLNGTSIGTVREVNTVGPPARFATEKASLFHPGVNTLRFRVKDVGEDTGVDYSATITYLP